MPLLTIDSDSSVIKVQTPLAALQAACTETSAVQVYRVEVCAGTTAQRADNAVLQELAVEEGQTLAQAFGAATGLADSVRMTGKKTLAMLSTPPGKVWRTSVLAKDLAAEGLDLTGSALTEHEVKVAADKAKHLAGMGDWHTIGVYQFEREVSVSPLGARVDSGLTLAWDLDIFLRSSPPQHLYRAKSRRSCSPLPGRLSTPESG